MLDNILNSVRRSADKVQRRGEEVAHSARLRVEVYQLSRELDSLYARLGRAYHAGSGAGVLEELSAEVRRLNDEIASREQLIAELNAVPASELRGAEAVHAAAARTRPPQEAAVPEPVRAGPEDSLPADAPSEPNLGDLPDMGRDAAHPVPVSDAPAAQPVHNAPFFVKHLPAQPPSPTAASRIWRAKEEERMTDHDVNHNETVDPTGPDNESVMMDLGKELPERRDYSGVGDEAERDKMRRRPIMLEEGEQASSMPDPLDK